MRKKKTIDKKKLAEEKKKLSALARIATIPEFAVLKEYVEVKKYNLGIKLLKDNEPDPAIRMANAEHAKGQLLALMQLIREIEQAADKLENIERYESTK